MRIPSTWKEKKKRERGTTSALGGHLEELHLPWEGTLTPAVRRKLGVFKNIVLKLLNRDPTERLSMSEFCVSCDRVVIGTTSIQAQNVCRCCLVAQCMV